MNEITAADVQPGETIVGKVVVIEPGAMLENVTMNLTTYKSLLKGPEWATRDLEVRQIGPDEFLVNGQVGWPEVDAQ